MYIEAVDQQGSLPQQQLALRDCYRGALDELPELSDRAYGTEAVICFEAERPGR
jgi:hypothetical protein